MTLGLRMIGLTQPRVRAKFRLRVSIHYVNIVPHTVKHVWEGRGGGGSDLTTDHTLTAVTVVTTR